MIEKKSFYILYITWWRVSYKCYTWLCYIAHCAQTPNFCQKIFSIENGFFFMCQNMRKNSNILIFIENKFSDDNWDSGRVCIGNISIMQSTILSIFCHFSRGRPRGNISLFPENSQKYKSKILAIKRSHSENDDFRYFQASRISILESTLEFLWRSGRRVITNSVCSGFWWFMVCPLPSKIWGKNVRSSWLLTLFLSSWHAFPALDFDNHDEETLKGGTPPYLWPIKVMLDCWSTRPKSSIGAEQKKDPKE